ncbi:MAG: LysM domain-containing protein, partial [Quadrisphaera sp.]
LDPRDGSRIVSLKSPRTWVVGGVLLALVLSVLGWQLVVAPQRAAADAARDQVVSARAVEQTQRVRLAQLTADSAQLETHRSDLATARTSIPVALDLPALTRRLTAAATGAGVTLMGVEPSASTSTATAAGTAPAATSEPATTSSDAATTSPAAGTAATAAPAAGLQVVPLRITVIGSFDGAEQFLRQLQSDDAPSLLVAGLSVTGQDPADASAPSRARSTATSSWSSTRAPSCSPPRPPERERDSDVHQPLRDAALFSFLIRCAHHRRCRRDDPARVARCPSPSAVARCWPEAWPQPWSSAAEALMRGSAVAGPADDTAVPVSRATSRSTAMASPSPTSPFAATPSAAATASAPAVVGATSTSSAAPTTSGAGAETSTAPVPASGGTSRNPFAALVLSAGTSDTRSLRHRRRHRPLELGHRRPAVDAAPTTGSGTTTVVVPSPVPSTSATTDAAAAAAAAAQAARAAAAACSAALPALSSADSLLSAYAAGAADAATTAGAVLAPARSVLEAALTLPSSTSLGAALTASASGLLVLQGALSGGDAVSSGDVSQQLATDATTTAACSATGAAPAPTGSTSTAAKTVIVLAGDTLSSIARAHGTTATALAQLNHLSDPDLIRVGQVLILPS